MSRPNRSHEMHPTLQLRARHVVASALCVALVAAVAATPQLLGDQVAQAFGDVADANPSWLWLAAACFAASIACSGCAWNGALGRLGGRTTRIDASARFGAGSLVNSVAPAKLGTALRFALLARTLSGEGRLWTTGGIASSVGAAHALWLTLLVGFAAASGALPAWPIAVLGLAVAVAAAVAFVARGTAPHGRVSHVLDAFRTLGRCPRSAAQLVGWVGLGVAARIGAATAIAAAVGVERPLAAAFLVVPALDLAGMLAVTPANIGVASAAVAFALKAHGAGADVALSAGIAFSAVETLTSVAFGIGGVLYLGSAAPGARRWTAAAAAATGCFALGAAFGATVVVPLV